MYFKRIEMHGFKSFAEPVVIEFHEGVTCIVGPNGSGKSNISDAIRWVLGEQSPKALRGGKMEEVIFSGTASRKSRGMAEVTLVIDNSLGMLPIDYNEVAITRRMYRSGESEYLINNNQCRLKDIRELIMDTGIGVDGYSLIGQGKIADIVSNKPESRREIFEEAAGIVLYKSRKQEAERKLASTNLNLDRANDIIGEIEGRIDGLKEDSKKAKEALELRDKRRQLEINITLRNVEKFSASNESGVSDIDKLNKDIEHLKLSKQNVDEKVETLREKNETLEQLGSEAKDKLVVKVEKIGEITNKSQLDGEKKAALERDENRLNEELESINLKLSKELENAENYERAKAEIEFNKKISEEELANRISKYNEIMRDSLDFNSKIESNKNRIMEIHKDISAAKSDIKSYDNYKESLLKRRSELIAESQLLEEGKNKAHQAIEAAEKEVENINQLLKKKEDSLSDLKNNKDIKNALLADLRKKDADIKIRGSQLTSRKKTIEEMEANYEGYNGAVKFLMKSDLKGISGVVAELISLPKGYEVAIETALGASLQNIICEKDDDAKKGVNLLKEHRAGRLTFLPMESVKGSIYSVNSAIKGARGFLGIGAEIIDFDKKYEGIFNYLLGKVAIVDNMDTAIRLSKISGNSLRFVTIDGEVINVSGAITGGKYKNTTATLLSRKGEIDNLRETLKALKADFEENKLKMEVTEKELLAVDDKLKVLEEEIKTLHINSANGKALLAGLKDSSKGQAESREKSAKSLAIVDEDVEKATLSKTKAEEKILVLEKELSEIEKALEEDISLGEAFKIKISDASEEITKARLKKTELDGAMEAQEQLLSRVLDLIDDYTEQIEAKEEALEEIEVKRLGLGTDNEEDGSIVQNLIKEKEELEAYIENVKLEREAISKELSEILEEQRENEYTLNSYVDQKQQQEIKLAKNETNLEAAKQKLWEDFEISYAQALEHRDENFVYSTAVKESREIKNRLDDLGDINVGAIKEYEEVKERYSFLTEQRDDILTAMNELKGIIRDMDKTIKSRFKENFDKVVINFEEIFKELFGGGYAELRLDNEDNPLEAGIEITAQPPGKKLQNINLMSGGEKTMTAIALMFAVLKTKPTPFCILDEVEAALDDANIDRFANYLKKFTEIQFAIVTHQKVTMEHADVLYGVTMPEQGISKVLSLRLGDNFDI